MKYTYAYKTSDGVRHEDSMNASSREEVFMALRKKGIKAIKVVAADGTKANGEIRGVKKRFVAVASISAAILAGCIVYLFAPERKPIIKQVETPPEIKFTTDESRIAFTNLEAKASQIVLNHYNNIKSLELDLLADYKFIANEKNAAVINQKAKQGYKAVDDSRIKVRNLFKSIFEIFPLECTVEREEAQRLYAEAMDKLDASEFRLVKDEKAAKILISNRDKWQLQDGKVVWKDAALANEFEYFRRETQTSSQRRGTAIESQIIELPRN